MLVRAESWASSAARGGVYKGDRSDTKCTLRHIAEQEVGDGEVSPQAVVDIEGNNGG